MSVKHHTNEGECPSCGEKFKSAHPDLREWFYRTKSKYPDLHAAWVFRGPNDQTDAFIAGKSQVRWPNSKHNHMKEGVPQSLACDLFQLSGVGVAKFPFKYYQDIALDNVERGEPIKWGGDFKTLSDQDHFELIV